MSIYRVTATFMQIMSYIDINVTIRTETITRTKICTATSRAELAYIAEYKVHTSAAINSSQIPVLVAVQI